MMHFQSPPSWTPTALIRWLFTFVVIGLVGVVVHENIRHFLEVHHWDEFLTMWWDAMLSLPPDSILNSKWAWPVFTFSLGIAAALWIVRLWPERSPVLAVPQVQPPTPPPASIPPHSAPLAKTSRRVRTAQPSVGRWPKLLAALFIVAILIASYDLVDRNWLSRPEPIETAIGRDNARLDFQGIQQIWDRRLFVNFILSNDGSATSDGLNNIGFTMTSPILIDNDLVDAIFIVLKSRLKVTPMVLGNEIVPGQSNRFYSVPNVEPGIVFDDNALSEYKNGRLLVYIFTMINYSDKTMKSHRSIFGERCIYYKGQELHNCEGGHNRTFVGN